jgi:hypothetical protein
MALPALLAEHCESTGKSIFNNPSRMKLSGIELSSRWRADIDSKLCPRMGSERKIATSNRS